MSYLVSIISFFVFIIKVCFVFLVIILVRVTNPRLKLEGITKLTWVYVIILVFLSFIFFSFGFYFY